ncbi:hypothetical protein BGW42_006639 [Actinomortierella wolfii]|nr:hypothetical protein BGW42_006639 [Actinomortierella wolfii]
MPNLPLECIAWVIEYVDSYQDLFSLLTVSKDVFLIAARRLYRDPIRSRFNMPAGSFRKLILHLLTLSPAKDENIDIIRRSSGLPPSGTPLDPQPMLNYLSLVKVVRWRDRDNSERWLKINFGCDHFESFDMCMHLTWAFVGHRLDEVEELEIDVKDQERYFLNATKMTRLRRIWIYKDYQYSYEEMHSCAEAMIKAIQLHHGYHQLYECHMIPNPIVEGPSADNSNHATHDIDISGAWRVLSHLPPPRHYLTLPRPDGSTVSLDQPFDSDVAMIERMYVGSREYFPLPMKAMKKVHPGHSQGQILQRFRGMKFLSIHYDAANGDDENLLAWAACEAERYYHLPGGHQLGPLVPLEGLEIFYGCSYGFEQPRAGTIPKWKILQDGLLGFSHTLKSLTVSYLPSIDGMVDRLFTVPRPLHKLSSLRLHALAIDRSVWEQAPNVEELYISFSFSLPSPHAIASNNPQDDQNTELTSPPPIMVDSATPVTPEAQSQRQLPEIWFRCPKLRWLTLKDRAINLLDPDCLHFSPNLQRLELLNSRAMVPDNIYSNGAATREEAAAFNVLHSSHWTWDWSFPALRTLTLKGNFRHFKFSFAILRSCPTIEEMHLDHRNVHRYPLRVKGILDTPLDKNDNQMLSFTHSCLTSIRFYGYWDAKLDELACLLQVLQSLKEINLKSVDFDERVGDRELIEITRTHPALTHVFTIIERTTEPPSALGLSEIIDQPQDRGVLVGGIPEESDNEVRTGIFYSFAYPGRFFLPLS